MSFFKKLTEDFKELKTNFGDKKEGHATPSGSGQEANRGYGDSSYSAPPPPQPPYAQQYGAPQQYNAPPQGQQYGQQFGQPQYQSQAPPPQPPRWIQQIDQASGRPYFVETTGRSQWEPPAESRDMTGGQPQGFYNQYAGAMPAPGPQSNYQHDQNAQQYYGDVQKKEKDNSGRNMLLAGAAGVALGGVAAAALIGMLVLLRSMIYWLIPPQTTMTMSTRRLLLLFQVAIHTHMVEVVTLSQFVKHGKITTKQRLQLLTRMPAAVSRKTCRKLARSMRKKSRSITTTD